MTDTELLDWIEKEKPDIWWRTGYGVWAVSAEMDDPDFPNYDGKTLREAITTAMDAWEQDE